ncbi:hypothetical protein ACFZA9_21890 [Streptomyces olivaceus]|uniref:hypothetical protein n=1 Tax=Streptomyces olivaceus TaxID=47716 RepID=UPI0036E6EFA4
MIEIDNLPECFAPEKVDVQKFKNGLVKVRFTLEGKRYKMLMETDVFNSLESPPGEVIKEVILRGGDEERHAEWEKKVEEDFDRWSDNN